MTDDNATPEAASQPAKRRPGRPAKKAAVAPEIPPSAVRDIEPVVPPAPSAAEVAAEAKPKRRPARAKSTPSTDTHQPELPSAPEAPSAPAPARAPEPETPRAATPPPFIPIQIVGEDTPAKPRTGDSDKRHEAVEFDPSAIFARFAPKPEDKPAEPAPAPRTEPESRPVEAGTWESARPEVSQEPSRENAENRPEGEPSAESGDTSAAGQQQPRHGDRRDGRHPNDRRDGRQGGNQQQQQGRHPNDRQGHRDGRHPNDRQGGNQQQQGRHPNDRQGQRDGRHPNDRQNRPDPRAQNQHRPGISDADTAAERELAMGEVFDYNSLNDETALTAKLESLATAGEPLEFNALYASSMNDIVASAKNLGLRLHRTPQRRELVGLILDEAGKQGHPIALTGTLELLEDGNGLLVYGFDNYKVRELSAFIPKLLIKKHALLRGHEVSAIALPAPAGETAPMVVKVNTVMGLPPEEVAQFTPFTELTPYYPTKRILLETENTVGWDNLSMRCVDLLCPIGLGQRGLIVAPPRTGKTVLMQAMANSMVRNYPEAHLIVLLVDERPEEVTDFKRNTKAHEIVSSTFDDNAESHVHAAEMVIERARRMVEAGRHVIILLDSITRLARAYNTMVPSTGKILSGGVEAGALTRPKRFFGSARNIEGGGSLTILGTALVDTGSKMDEVIFEEFKGTGNMELDLDRDLSNKRIFPAINFEKSGTRKEELLYHPDEMAKVYALRRAMKGVPSVEAMEMLIQRIKKTKTNSEFLMTLSR